MAEEQQAQNGVVQVQSTADFLDEDTEERQIIEVPTFEVEPAKVTAGVSFTVNLGDYESAKPHCSVSIPCYPNDEDIRETYQHANDLVKEFIGREVKALNKKKQERG